VGASTSHIPMGLHGLLQGLHLFYSQNRHDTPKQRTFHSSVTNYITYVHAAFQRSTARYYDNPKLRNDNDKPRPYKSLLYIAEYLLKARTVEPETQPLLGNDCVTRKNGVIVESGVFCAVRSEDIYRGPAVITGEP
jgi:hypothetical protein